MWIGWKSIVNLPEETTKGTAHTRGEETTWVWGEDVHPTNWVRPLWNFPSWPLRPGSVHIFAFIELKFRDCNVHLRTAWWMYTRSASRSVVHLLVNCVISLFSSCWQTNAVQMRRRWSMWKEISAKGRISRWCRKKLEELEKQTSFLSRIWDTSSRQKPSLFF